MGVVVNGGFLGAAPANMAAVRMSAVWEGSGLSLLTLLAALCLLVQSCWCMECYVCTKQDGNADKCLKTIKTCEPEEDTCLTEIRWGSTPYWDEGARKQYYVSKRCSTRADCEDTRSSFMPYCHRIWYEDWKCAECCQGDRCNYYAILGASTVHFNLMLLLSGAFLTLFYHRFLNR